VVGPDTAADGREHRDDAVRRRQQEDPRLGLVLGQADGVGAGVLLEPGDPPGAGNRGDVVALGEQPGQRDLRRCGARLGGDGLDLVDDAQVAVEVLGGKARGSFAPVVVGDVFAPGSSSSGTPSSASCT
jgi:hypothetical protein